MIKQYMDYYKIRFGSEEGATAVEYGIMVVLIAVVIIATVAIIGRQLDAGFQTVVDELRGPTGTE